MALFTRQRAHLQTLLLLFVYVLPRETGTQASSGGCSVSTSALGIANTDEIPNSDITASSKLNASSVPSNARLQNNKAWVAETNDKHPWIQVNLREKMNITAIDTQGFPGLGYILSFYLSYGGDGNNWWNYSTPEGNIKVFPANTNDNETATVVVNSSVTAQYIRLHPTNCSTHCALRMELYGCKSGFPGQPSSPTVKSVSSTTIIITWNAPSEIGDGITGYNVRYQKVNGTMWHFKVVQPAPSGAISATINVDPYTWYNILVQAFTDKLTGAWSVPLRERSKESVPSAAPGNFQLGSSSPLSLDASWDAIPVEKQRGKLLGYRVYYMKQGSGAELNKSVSPSQLSYKITGLQFASYSVRVVGYTAVGEGNSTASLTKFPGEGAPSSAPVINQGGTKAEDAHTIIVTWKEIIPKDQNGVILGYTVAYYKVKDQSAEFHQNATATSTTIRGLKPYTKYCIKVRGFTRIGPSPWGNCSYVTTLESAPSSAPVINQGGTKAEDAHTIIVTWKEIIPKDQNGVILGYTVAYYKVKDQSAEFHQNATATSTTIRGLKPYTKYCIKVRGFTRIGPSPWGNCSYVTTLESAPSSAPVINQGGTKAEDAHTIIVTWKEIIPKDQNGVILGYTVAYYKVKDQSAEFHQNATATSTTIRGLKPYTKYCIKVRGFTRIGPSPWGNCSYVTTLESAPSSAPVIHQGGTKAEDAHTIIVTWKEIIPKDQNGVILGYTVAYYKVKDQSAEFHQNATATSTTIRGLKPDTKYCIKVRGFTRIGPSPWGNCSYVTTLESGPSKPQDVVVKASSSVTIYVKWKEPAETNGVIKKYIISYGISKDHQADSKEVTNNTFEWTLDGLKKFTTYYIKVRGSTTKIGNASEVLNATTFEDFPSKPRDVKAKLDDGNIDVFWEEPADLNGKLTQFKVYCDGTRRYNHSFQSKIELVESETSRYTSIAKARLTPGTTYTVYVTAYTVIGEGKKSDDVVVNTPPIAPPAPVPPRVVDGDVTPNTITISLTKTSDKNGKVVVHEVVVEKLRRVSKRSTGPLPDNIFGYNEAKANGDRFYIAARFERNKQQVPEQFVLGDGKTYGGFVNAPLEPETEYKAYLRAATDVEGKWVYGEPAAISLPPTGEEPKTSTGSDNVGIIAGILGALVLIVIVGIAVLLYKKTNRPPNANLDVENQKRKRREFELKRSSTVRKVLAAPGEFINDADHPPIPADQFAKHVIKLHKSDDRGYMIEYNKLDSGQEYAITAGQLNENKAKNRYANIIAYDHSRVVLSAVDGIVGSDYVNATRVDGYNKPNAYIATQGPVPPTFDDFWRMVWEQQSSTIIMLTNLQERHKLKCHKYWPDETQDYGDITVMLVKQEHYSDYIIRTFNVKRESEKEEREVKQFHFTVWPDHGVPEYPTALLAFRRRVRTYNPADAGPMIVHCSAGVGRTGTFMVVDSMLDRIKAENSIDIYNFVAYLRTRRTAMVQTEEQYTFCHDAILEALQCGNTQIYAHDLRITLSRMNDVTKESKVSRFESEFKTLNKVSPVPHKGSYLVASYPENKEKNRNPEILASDFHRVVLTAIDDNEATSYINAVHIPGYKQQSAFIVTQHPLTPTVTDFWRMLCEQECSCVVLFDSSEEDGDFPLFWPEEESTYDDMITVQRLHASSASSSVDNLKAEYDQSEISEKTFKATDLRTPEKSLRIKMFQYSGWINEKELPPCSGLITLIAKVEKWQQHSGNGPIAVVCSDGLGRSGTFCALSSVLERLKIEQVVDVFQAIKAMRISRPGLVKTAAEYRFIHYAILDYLAAFDDYANFKP